MKIKTWHCISIKNSVLEAACCDDKHKTQHSLRVQVKVRAKMKFTIQAIVVVVIPKKVTSSGVDFTIILYKAFAQSDLKSAKKTDRLTVNLLFWDQLA